MNMKSNNTFIYFTILFFSVLFLFVGSWIVSSDAYESEHMDNIGYYAGVVTQIIDRIEHDFGFFDGNSTTEIIFEVRITDRSERRGELVIAEQQITDFFIVNEREVSAGDRITLFYAEWNDVFHFAGYQRVNYIAILGILFIACVILFGRKKGFNAIIALGFTCLAIFLIFIPAILSGMNIYVITMIICIYSIVTTLLIVIGVNKKALSAMLGCLGGVILAGSLMFIMDAVLRLTGALDRDTEVLLLLENPIDLRAIVFAGVILGAVGAIMDVAMSIASSLWEVREVGGASDFKSILKSGINIGKDILGTMLNTLILAYIGSSLSLILLITANAISFAALFNMELIIVELLRALIGSFGMLLTIPLTAVICGWLYTLRQDDDAMDEYDEYFGPRT